MPQREAQTSRDPPTPEVLTLAEAAEYLRVPEDAVLKLVKEGTLPAQRIGGEWRFLKRAVVEWLGFEPYLSHGFRMYPPGMLEDWISEKLLQIFESHLLSRQLSSAPPPLGPGSKDALLKHFGIFKDDADLEEQLARIRAGRGAAGE